MDKLPNQQETLPRFRDLSTVQRHHARRQGLRHSLCLRHDRHHLRHREGEDAADLDGTCSRTTNTRATSSATTMASTISPFTALDMGIADPFHLSDEQLQAAKAKLIDMKHNLLSLYTTADEALQLYQQNDVALIWANYGQQQVKTMKDAGARSPTSTPKEGALAWLDTWAMTSGVQNQDLAEKWVISSCRRRSAARLSERQGFGNTAVEFPQRRPGRQDRLARARWRIPPSGPICGTRSRLRHSAGSGSPRFPATVYREAESHDTRLVTSVVELQGVSFSYGSVEVLHAIDLAVRGRRISGRARPERLRQDHDPAVDRRISRRRRAARSRSTAKTSSHVPINRRPFNTVFQDYALFPHMTAEENVGYGLPCAA